MHRFQGAESLVDKVLAVIVGQVLRTNDTMHISFHEFLIRSAQVPSFNASGEDPIYLDEIDF